MTSPYSNLPPTAFWRQAVAERDPRDPGEVFAPRFPIDQTARIMTAGSCFAQHVGRTLKEAGFNVLDVEPAPPRVDTSTAQRFGYGMFTGRYGNIYTTRQLVQLFQEAHGEIEPANPVWERNGLFFDAQRPNVEPEGLDSPETVMRLRAEHLEKILQALSECEIFVFTFGLTEAWIHTESQTVYPTAPGTLAGSFDPEIYSFRNYTHSEVLADFLYFRRRIREINPGIRFLITTSPVPLTATASGQHVEVATAYSKAVLRAVCGELYQTHQDIDYFPSFEIITSQRTGGGHFERNLRSVAPTGVQTAMATFMQAHGVALERPKVLLGRIADLMDGIEDQGAALQDGLFGQMSLGQLRGLLGTVRATLQHRRAAHFASRGRGGPVEGASAKQQAGPTAGHSPAPQQSTEEDVVCEEALLEAFGK